MLKSLFANSLRKGTIAQNISQEVRHHILVIYDILLLFGGVEDVKLATQVLVNSQNTRVVSTAITVVRCAKYCDYVALM